MAKTRPLGGHCPSEAAYSIAGAVTPPVGSHGAESPPTGKERQAARREAALSCLGILLTLLATGKVGGELATILGRQVAAERWGAVVLHVLFCTIVAALIYGGLVFLVTRALYYWRKSRHAPELPAELEALLARGQDAPPLTILIPSFKEDPRIVLRTLLSAAFQTYPKRRVVLLIDDPPSPGNAADRAALASTRQLPAEVAALLSEPRSWIATCGDAVAPHGWSAPRTGECLARVAGWFESLAARFDRGNHEDGLFIERVLLAHAERCRRHAADIDAACRRNDPTAALDGARAARDFLAALFAVEVEVFERKQFANLSHEPNKAMNLNSYIGLIGKSFAVKQHNGERVLIPTPANAADLHVPGSKYLITLDADSVIVPDYALRLVHFLQRPGNERVAVVQTPYSAFPGAPGRLERLAGATTDIQYIIHQGFTACAGTYWVGANAVLRKAALDDIVTHGTERGYLVARYIHDRTVIEDTESSIDLVTRGWSLHNYPERLAFSATPPDFGALLIQRRRWANGGLIILPKLLRYLAGRALRLNTWLEAFVRVHYLASITAVNVGLLVVLAVPFTESIHSWWLPATAVPYFLLYARDLQLLGYRARDVFGVYALNLLLIPVNLGGVLKSLQQAWSGAKTPFGRTPKVEGRTAAGALYVIAVYVLVLWWMVNGGVDFWAGRIIHGSFAVLNALFLGYAAVWLVGIAASREDVVAELAPKIRRLRNQPSYSPVLYNPAVPSPAPRQRVPRTRASRRRVSVSLLKTAPALTRDSVRD